MKRIVLSGAILLLLVFLLSPVLSSKPQEAFIEPSREEWAQMTPATREAALQSMKEEGERQRAVGARYDQDQKEGVCHVHHEKLERRTVEVPLGMPEATTGPIIPRAVLGKYRAAAAARFPNAIDSVAGSCIALPGAPRTEEIGVCASCVAAKRKAELDLGLAR